jgi:hypothetical protein
MEMKLNSKKRRVARNLKRITLVKSLFTLKSLCLCIIGIRVITKESDMMDTTAVELIIVRETIEIGIEKGGEMNIFYIRELTKI